LLRDLRKKFPTLKISLREGYPAHLEHLLAKEEIDLAVTLLEKKTATGIHTRELLELPMVLLVDKDSGITSAEQLWKRDKIVEPLICLPPGELLYKQFQQKLTDLGVDWFPSIEASSADWWKPTWRTGWASGSRWPFQKNRFGKMSWHCRCRIFPR